MRAFYYYVGGRGACKKPHRRLLSQSWWEVGVASLNTISFLGSSNLRLEKAMAPYSSTLAWKIPWMEEPPRLQSMGLLRVGHG